MTLSTNTPTNATCVIASENANLFHTSIISFSIICYHLILNYLTDRSHIRSRRRSKIYGAATVTE